MGGNQKKDEIVAIYDETQKIKISLQEKPYDAFWREHLVAENLDEIQRIHGSDLTFENLTDELIEIQLITLKAVGLIMKEVRHGG